MIEQATLVALSLFIIGLVYHAGRMSARLDGVERAVIDARTEVRRELGELKDMLKAAIGDRRHWREES